MRRVLSFVLAVLAAALLALSCEKKASVIPKSTLSKIYMEMFLVDKWLMDYPQGLKADTTLVYESIFNKYGYTSDDYRESVSFYLKDPDRYARILRETSAMMDAQIKVLEARKAVADAAKEAEDRLKSFAPERIYRMTGLSNKGIFSLSDSVSVFVDTAGGKWDFDPQIGRDTIFRGPEIVVDTLTMSDTLGVEKTEDIAGEVDILLKETPMLDVKIR